MVGGDTFLWLGWLGFAAAAVLSIWAFRGRRTDRPFCRHCGHSVVPSGSVLGTTCPECGAVFRRPRDVQSRRRRPV